MLQKELEGLSVPLSVVDNLENRERYVALVRLRNDDQFTVLCLLVGLSICALLWLWFDETSRTNVGGMVENPRKELRYLVDLNNAPRNELLQLPGIGETLAERIVEYRDDVASFKNVTDLEKIQGIGVKKRESATPYVYIP